MKVIYCLLRFVYLHITHVHGQTKTSDWTLPEGCVEFSPQFPGGSKAIRRIIRDSARWNEQHLPARSSDTVIVHFAINTCGNPVHIKVYKSGAGWMDEEAVRLVGLLNGWKPGTLNDRKVVDYVSQPFVFKAP